MDKRIVASFPIAGSTPCSMRNPIGLVSGQNWTGDDDEDFEQSCRPNTPTANPHPSGDNQPGRAAFATCNYTCQYLLAGLEPGRSQVQILHEYDTCCFSPHNRHDGMLEYESNIRRELMGGDRSRAAAAAATGHGWFTSVAVNHSKHEVDAQSKTVIRNAMKLLRSVPGSPVWDQLPCDIMHQQGLPANCEPNVEPGLVGDPYVPQCPTGMPKRGHSWSSVMKPCNCTRPPPYGHFPCQGGQMPTAAAAAAGTGFASAQAYFAAAHEGSPALPLRSDGNGS